MDNMSVYVISYFFFIDVSIEISLSKDQSLTMVINGREQAVMRARREVLAKLQTQVVRCLLLVFTYEYKYIYALSHRISLFCEFPFRKFHVPDLVVSSVLGK